MHTHTIAFAQKKAKTHDYDDCGRVFRNDQKSINGLKHTKTQTHTELSGRGRVKEKQRARESLGGKKIATQRQENRFAK